MIELINVSGGYGKTDILRGLSLTLNNGAITAVIGANGCGKSTLLKMICGHIKHTTGDILINKKSLSDTDRQTVARKIAYLPQSRFVPDIHVEMLVLHGRFPHLGFPRVYRAVDKDIADDAMRRAGILDLRRKRLTEISGGERQKAYLAMALAQSAEHLLLDEPASYLDAAYQLELIRLITELKGENTAVAAVMHDINTAIECADYIAVMKDGAFLKTGTPDEICSSGVLEEAFNVKVTYKKQIAFTPL